MSMNFSSEKRFLMLVSFVELLIAASYAQERVLVFNNIFSGKQVHLKKGDEMNLRFTVHDTASAPLDVELTDITVMGTIESIGEQFIVMSAKNKWFDRASVVIPVQSIEAFRKYSRFRPVAKAASTVAVSAAGLLTTLQISNSDEILSWENAGLAAGASSAIFLNRSLFSDKMKYYTSEGWTANVVFQAKRN